ncbi:18S rRNA (guanine1575-N7)-methyltransferase [Dispira simplex]|nr:18S rRNA (guanine1575-N7)-methyltransferase [Dispira simplex]
MSRPEHIAPPEVFYNDTEANKYTSNSRIASIQAEMSFRALELLNLPADRSCFLLDIGCGSGLSGEVIEEEGHTWVGLDIAPAMLEIAQEREVEGDLFLHDIGQGVGFRPGVFDGAVSISVLQWLCNADSSVQRPKARLNRFFSTLYGSLAKGARAVFQFYPENDDQLDLILTTATRCGFMGGLVIDYPNSKKARKYFLCLFAGQATPGPAPQMPRGLDYEGVDGHESSVAYSHNRLKSQRRRPHGASRVPVKDRNWVIRKKEAARARGEDVPKDSKYTARKRRTRF